MKDKLKQAIENHYQNTPDDVKAKNKAFGNLCKLEDGLKEKLNIYTSFQKQVLGLFKGTDFEDENYSELTIREVPLRWKPYDSSKERVKQLPETILVRQGCGDYCGKETYDELIETEEYLIGIYDDYGESLYADFYSKENEIK